MRKIETKNRDSLAQSRHNYEWRRNLRNRLLDEASNMKQYFTDTSKAVIAGYIDYIDRFINKFTVVPCVLFIALSPFFLIFLLLTLPFPLNMFATFIGVVGYEMTFWLRHRRPEKVVLDYKGHLD